MRPIGERFEIGIPWKQDQPNLPDNRGMAERRLRSLEAHLKKKPEVQRQYRDAFQQNVDKGYIQKVGPVEAARDGWYLPHFAIVKQDKQTTKVRIVYDAAARFGGTSLNDEMLPGPNLQKDILEILLNFRRRPVALIGDVKEMFSQIVLQLECRRYHRLLWRDCYTYRPMDTYEAVRVTFGDRASPFLAMYVLQEQARRAAPDYPLASQVIKDFTYMDDVTDSFETTAIAAKMIPELKTVVKPGGWTIRRWSSNEREVLVGLSEEDKATGVRFRDSDLPTMKTLGVWWDAETDVFSYSVKFEMTTVNTKRELLSLVASVFDPFQFLAPLVIRGKIALQGAWMSGKDWDAQLTPDVKKVAKDWIQEMSQAQDLKIPRCNRTRPITDVKHISIHVFSDASQEAYAACCYIRFLYDDDTTQVTFVAAKARVAPLRAISIPRLELMAAVLGVRLARIIAKMLEISIGEHRFWTDSTDVLYWIRGQS
ncbi:uncharacterized protein LOC135494368 [Lineus longissimus]|uniref:uncharacterized protein LOC135494368 n=1 Tax=Lineus longissimus TaxID=88925 RepID=UPI00315CBE31